MCEKVKIEELDLSTEELVRSFYKDIMENKVRIEELDPTSQELLKDFFKGCRFRGPTSDTGYTMPVGYKNQADNVRNMDVRPDDVWVTGFVRCGTTLAQELVWLVVNDCDFKTALKIPLMERYMFLEGTTLSKLFKEKMETFSEAVYSYEAITNAPSPRFIKTHVPFSLLPPNLLDTTKVVYIARDPRDVAVSYHQISRLMLQYPGDFKSYWNLLVNDLVMFAPIFKHMKEAWALRHHHNLLFMFYEDVLKDLPSSIKQVADFFGKKLTDEQMMKLREHLNIKNFRKNESVNPTWLNKGGNPKAEGFVRKGKSGAWREHFDEEMTAQALRWMRDNLAGTDLRFSEDS